MMGFQTGFLRAAVVAAAFTVAADQAKAVTLTAADVGSTFTVEFDYRDLGTLVAEFDWTLDSIVGNVWNFTIDIANLSSNSPNQNRITSFGVSATPNVSLGITDSDGGLWTGVSTNPSAGYQLIGVSGIEDCVRSGANNCQGGGGGGIAGGGTSTMGLALTLLTPGTSLTFDNFAVRYQSISVLNADNELIGSVAFEGYVAAVPLPAAGWLMLAGLGGLAALRRRRKAV